MTQPHPFRRALEAGDVEAMAATLSPDVVFHGPAVPRPLVGRAEVIGLLQAIVATFQVFTQEFRDGPRTALVFEAQVRDRVVQGVSLLEDDEHGLIKTITVMVRPLSRFTARGDTARAASRWFINPPAADRLSAGAGRSRRVPAPG
jgi:SnoaL-like domain